MRNALFKKFMSKPDVNKTPDNQHAEALANLNARVQRMLALHTQANILPQSLPGA